MTYFTMQLLNGLQIGSIYALIALGYTMVYGIIKLINFAHGEIMMTAAYSIYFFITLLNIPFIPATLLAMLLSMALGMFIERLAYRRLRSASRLSALITAIAVSLFLQTGYSLLFSPDPRAFPVTASSFPVFHIGEISLSSWTLITIAVALTVMILLQLFVTRHKAGKAMLVVSEDVKGAYLMGIKVNSIVSMTFAIGSALAAIAAALFIVSYPQITPYMGAMPGIKAFIAAVLGGIGLIPGAMLGGFLLGLIETMTRAYIPSSFSQLSEGVVFIVLILVLLLKPAGMLGKSEREKV
ncbi:MAG TPA: branched-chain amino acid ABC transporter permease [Oscillospiraceae bacterium]|jgi:branched-chain amino acid transport system permease protein|nr:branched-chain amino acid ABC transporter permease [Oscillospiraceae bacterium]